MFHGIDLFNLDAPVATTDVCKWLKPRIDAYILYQKCYVKS